MSLRDVDIPNVVFVNSDGKSFTIKDMKEYTPFDTWFQYPIKEGDELYEIASRQDVYGEDSEAEYYRIAEHNIAALFNVQFDLSKLTTLNIPLR